MVISTPFPPEEGIGYHVYNISKKLIERGHDITVITRGKFRTEIGSFDRIRIIKVPFLPLFPFHVHIHGFLLNRLFKHLENEFDIVHIHTPLTPLIKTSLPIVSTIHGSMVENAKGIELIDHKAAGNKIFTKFFGYPLVSKLINDSKVVTTVSLSVEKELNKYYDVDGVLITGNGVDVDNFKPADGGSKNYVLYVGRLSHGKGLFDLLKASKELISNYDVSFILIGKGVLSDKLNKIIEKTHNKNFHLLGQKSHDELIKYYQEAKLFISPSYYESGPLTLLEAMACGKPAIATKVGIAPDCIKNEENGILINPRSPQEIVKSVSMLLDDEELCNKMGENARRTIEESYSWNSVADKVEQIYLDLV
ncbi:MAG: putative glycosyl transferase [Candidatus Methanofastidiosum methylothiophilum]|uniref:Putative glycosyl transferase n=1 Tax=Candidatus Methanofastidiosum methylothiophilum TaxID=1705564 RepID=A0A150IPG2_9EURY|nr:MAG: putative glycosyl transferase [Candidatus Methanofastidiosum methylthiophilus]KYC46941.1 MAG: putative glycosyl transferase [Candidatus Methanofastidiosum methylthiophilus]